MRSSKPHPAAACQRGLTLIELLVSMVILSFVMALVSQAVFQVAQVTRAADATTRGLAARWGAGWSASSLFANLVAPQEATGPSFEGTASRVSGFSTLPLEGGGVGVQGFALTLRVNAGSDVQTDLLAAASGADGARGVAPVVATFPGRAEFAFVDGGGKTLDTWPPLTRRETDAEDLPRIVLVRDARSGQVLMWYGFQGETTRPKPTGKPFGDAS